MLREINGYDGRHRPAAVGLHRAAATTAPPPAAAGSTPASTPTGSTRRPAASPAREQDWVAPRVGLGLAGEPAHPLQPRLRRPGRAGRGASARSTSGGTPEAGEWTGHDVPDFEKTKPPSYRPPPGATGVGGARRRRPVHHAGRRQGLAVRAGRADRRAAADALRAGRVAGAQPALRAAGQPDPQGVRPRRTTRSTRARRSGTRGLPVRLHAPAGSPSTTPPAG